MTRFNGIHMTSKFGGPCWSRERGYHQPPPIPAHIMRIITAPQQTPSSAAPPPGEPLSEQGKGGEG